MSVNTKVIEALDIFYKRQVSALPVMDEDNKLVDIFAKFDVFVSILYIFNNKYWIIFL